MSARLRNLCACETLYKFITFILKKLNAISCSKYIWTSFVVLIKLKICFNFKNNFEEWKICKRMRNAVVYVLNQKKTTLFNCSAYNYNNNENNVSTSDFVFQFDRQFANEKQYLIFLRRECDNTTSINNRSWITLLDQKQFFLFRRKLIAFYQTERRSNFQLIMLI